MKIHHLSCGTLCPIGGRLMGDRLCSLLRGKLACHCLLIETAQGLVLVDTGLGLRDVHEPRQRISRFFYHQCKPGRDEAATAIRQVEALGFSAGDVRHIVLTHLDFDHAGGLDDFPEATVHLYADEAEAALGSRSSRSPIARGRYSPAQWRDTSRWTLYRPGGERWFGFEAVRSVAGLEPEILLVPLVGHTWGHCGVAVEAPGGGWLLHAGDAYFHRGEMNLRRYRCPPGLRYYQLQMEVDRRQRLDNQGRLRELIRRHGEDVRVFSAHDPVEYERYASVSPEVGRATSGVAADAPPLEARY